MQSNIGRLERVLSAARAMSQALDGPEYPYGIEPEEGLVTQFMPETWKRFFALRWRVVHQESLDTLLARVGEPVSGPKGFYEGLSFWRATSTCRALCDGFRAGRRHMAIELNHLSPGP